MKEVGESSGKIDMTDRTGRIVKIIDAVISEQIKASSSPAELYKVRFLAAIAAFFVFIPVKSVSFQLSLGAGFTTTLIIPTLSIFTSLTILALLKFRATPRAAMLFFQACFVIMLPIAVYHNGTILSPPMFFLPVIPLLFSVLGDTKQGFILFFVCFTITIVSVSIGDHNPYMDHGHFQTKSIVAVISAFAAAMIIGGLAYISKKLSHLVEDDLKTQTDIRENTEQMKTRFLANISHEIRTPLNNVIGHSELLRDRLAVHDFSHFHIENIFRSSRQLVEIINNIIEASRLDINTYSFEPMECDVARVIYDNAHAYIGDAEAKGVTVTVKVSDKLRHHGIVIAKDALSKVVYHLVSNAAKFTSEGCITIATEFDFVAKNLVLSVTDTGVGIHDDTKGGIYDKFIQGDEEMTREFGGLGLGLAITKTIIDKAFGEISIDSTPGVGTTFIVTLPARIVERQARAAKPVCTVHVVDPTWLIAEYLNAVAHELPISVVRYGSADQLRGARIASRDLIIVQNSHAGAVVTEAAEVIAERKLGNKVLIHGSDLSLQNRQNAKALIPLPNIASFADHLPKCPHSAQMLLAETNEDAKKILVVDDAEDNRTLMRLYLESQGFEIATAADGREAVEAVMTDRFDLILMDIQMPRMDGFEATAMIKDWERSQPGRAHTPIVIVTAHDIEEHKEQCQKLETAGFITKPLRKKSFIQEIDTVLVEIDRKKGAA